MNLKDNVLLEGKSSEAESIAWGRWQEGNSTNRHSTRYGLTCAFLARSSPDDNQHWHTVQPVTIYDKAVQKKLEEEDGIKIFPDRQVVAMTETVNDAPALEESGCLVSQMVPGTQTAMTLPISFFSIFCVHRDQL
jgi:hypothetical protein